MIRIAVILIVVGGVISEPRNKGSLIGKPPDLRASTPEPEKTTTAAPTSQHFEPKVAIFCPPENSSPRKPGVSYPSYITQYVTKSGEWLPDLSPKSTCTKDKLEILRTCQRLYPDHDITNIVESNVQVKITNMCKVTAQGSLKCTGRSETSNSGVFVTPYRCLESPFQSDALLVPSPCMFDHIHNASTCLEAKAWNVTAKKSCSGRNMELKSYAILLPCGVGLFAGVEFVCCPVTKHVSSFSHDLGVFNGQDEEIDSDDDDEDTYDEDDYDDDYLDVKSSSTTTTTTTTTTTAIPVVDPYFRRFDTYNEHSNYKSALHRLESVHRTRMQRVTNDWNEMEAKYQEMRSQGLNKEAEEFKHTITVRFQKTIKSLEEEGHAEKRQLIAVHQQRVLAHINERKKESMECYTQALNERPQNVNKIRKCVEKLMRVLHKDRHHTLAHYKHLLKSGGGTGVEEEYTLQRLVGISATARSCLQMLNRYGNLADELKPLIEDYVLSLQGRDDPPGSLLTATRDTEQLLLQKYRSQVIRKYVSTSELDDDNDDDVSFPTTTSGTTTEYPSTSTTLPTTVKDTVIDDSGADDYVGGEAQEPAIPHALVHESVKTNVVEKSRGPNIFDQTYTVRREVYHYRENKSVYFTMAFAGIAIVGAMVIGLVVLRRRANSPRNQGFLEVNTNMGFGTGQTVSSPEEKFQQSMQINGYENPTYKYFETANT